MFIYTFITTLWSKNATLFTSSMHNMPVFWLFSGDFLVFQPAHWTNGVKFGMEKSTKCMDLLYHHAKFGWACRSHVAGKGKRGRVRGGEENRILSSCLFCPSCFGITKIVCTTFPSTHWITETVLVLLDRGWFVVVHRIPFCLYAAG